MTLHQVNESPYARVGAKLVDSGYSAIPCRPCSKVPGAYRRGEWFNETDWTRFCDRLPTDIETDAWSKLPDAGVCIALGFNDVVAVDIDTDQHEIVEAILGALLCESPVQKCGKKGATHFFRASAAVKSRAFNVGADERVLDLLCRGKQTVIPPTRHPETERPYEWMTERTLEHVSPENLPMLPDDIAERIAAALKPFGYEPEVERPVPTEGDSLWREINDVALERFEDWVPFLGMDAKRKHNGTWRGRATWKNAENANVGFSPQGIKDWGEDLGLTAIDVTMKALEMDFGDAADWLRARLGFEDPEPVHFTFRKSGEAAPAPLPEPVSEPQPDIYLDEAMVHGILSARERFPDGEVFWRHFIDAAIAIKPNVDEADFTVEVSHIADWLEQAVKALEAEAALRSASKPTRRDPLDAITLGRGVDWQRPDGLLGEMADWILATSQSPNRPLAVAAADATMAVVAGRASLYGPTLSALNVYTVLLGKTTIGKDRALKAVEQILRAAHLSSLCGGDGYSLSAMEAMISDSPAIVMTVDEIAKNLFPRMLGGRASSHEMAILGFLLKLFTRNMGDPPYTSTRRSPKSIIQHISVDSPQFSLLGASTSEGFYGALQAGNMDDGFMNRLTVVEAAPRESNNAVRAAAVPQSICDALLAIVTAERSMVASIAMRPTERMIPWASPDVEREWQRLRDQVYDIIDAVPTKEGSLYGRIAEQTIRFASRHALSRDRVAAAVDIPDLEWGAAFVLQSARTIRDGAAEMMADSEFGKNVNTILALVRKHGTIKLSELADRLRIEPRKRDSAISHLRTALQIEMTEQKTNGRPVVIIRHIGG
jgi:bifunctional DNA primase/polymerase-like protein